MKPEDAEQDGAAPFNQDGAGRWISLGGKLRWHGLQHRSAEDEDDDEDAGDEVPPADYPGWESDLPPIPTGAPERVRLRVALTWLGRQMERARDTLGELALREHEAHVQRESEPPRRHRGPTPPDPLAIERARAEGTAAWFEDASVQLCEEAERTPGRALVEWYLALLTESEPEAEGADALAQARAEGRAVARERALRYAERLAQPEIEDDM